MFEILQLKITEQLKTHFQQLLFIGVNVNNFYFLIYRKDSCYAYHTAQKVSCSAFMECKHFNIFEIVKNH